jgi:ArsR family transcriptional regulator, virulence genes transcriptional regulator
MGAGLNETGSRGLTVYDSEIEIDAGAAQQTQGAVHAANILRALANPHRLLILRLLEQSPHNVMDLCERLNLRQSLVSQHLARLRLDGIVAAERQGHHVVYSLRDGKARDIMRLLSEIIAPPNSARIASTSVDSLESLLGSPSGESSHS